MLRAVVTSAVCLLLAAACSDDDESSATTGAGGKSGTSGASGKSGAAGDAATTGGAGGSSASAGVGGQSSGAGGAGAVSGQGGAGGSTGQAGVAGADAGGGSGGAPGSGGTAGDASACTSPSGKGPCDTVPQCGCASGQNCDVTASDGTTECMTSGSVAPYNACTDAGQCQKGYTCVVGACHEFCEDATSVCPGSGYATCSQASMSGTQVPGYFVCSRTCYPVDPSQDDAMFDPCGPGLACYPTSTHDSYCFGPTDASGTQDVYCGDLSGNADPTLCAPGYFCDETSVRCLKFCRMASSVCPGSTTCHNFNPVLFAGSESIGYCL